MSTVTASTFETHEISPAVGALQAKPELRVLQVFSVLAMGGAETWLMSLLKYFHENRDEIPVRVKFDILLTSGEKGVFDDEAAALGARLFYVPFTRRKILGFIRNFRNILKEGDYHAIHDHQDYIAGLHFLAGLGRLPWVRIAHVHNPLYHRATYATDAVRSFSSSIGKRLVLSMGTHVLGTSRQIIGEYGFSESYSKDLRLEAVHCGFEVTKYRGDRDEIHSEVCHEFGWNKEAKIILFVGRLDGAPLIEGHRIMSHKNPAFALDVARECMATDENVRLIMVGAGEAKRKEFEAKVNDWGLGKKIRFAGLRSDVQRLMLGSNLLLFPSLAEGLGMVVVEAQAAGLRVLASDTTPAESIVIPELVKFLSLDLPARAWAAEATQAIRKQLPNAGACNSAVQNSPYSIGNSAAALLQVLNKGCQDSKSLRAS